MNTSSFPGIKSLSVARETSSFEIFIGGDPAPRFVPIDILATPSLTWFYGERQTQFNISYRKFLSPGDYKLDASELRLSLLCRDHNFQLHGRDEMAEGEVIVSVEKTTESGWFFNGSLDITFTRPLPIIRVKGAFSFYFVYE